MERFSFTGYLASDAKVIDAGENGKFLRFTVYTNSRGSAANKAECTYNEKKQEYKVAEYLKKGCKIFGEATSVTADCYTNKENQVVPVLRAQVKYLELLDRKPDAEETTTGERVDDLPY